MQSPSSPTSRMPALSLSTSPSSHTLDPSAISSPSSVSSPNVQQQQQPSLPNSTSQNLSAISETAGVRTFSDSENELDYEAEDEEDEEEDDDEGEEGEEDGEMRRKVEGERVLKSGYLEKKGEKRKVSTYTRFILFVQVSLLARRKQPSATQVELAFLLSPSH